MIVGEQKSINAKYRLGESIGWFLGDICSEGGAGKDYQGERRCDVPFWPTHICGVVDCCPLFLRVENFIYLMLLKFYVKTVGGDGDGRDNNPLPPTPEDS